MRELFLTSVGGIQYGIWKDEIKSVTDLNALHRIPLSPASIAGISIVDGRAVTLADIPVCMGYESSQGIEQGVKQGNILLKQEGEKLMGFVVSGEIRTQSISPKLLFPLPDFLKTPVFDSCAVHDDIPIPVINTTVLHSRVLLGSGDESTADSYRIHNAQPQDISAMARIRIFSAGGELFAVSAAGMEDKAVKPGPVTPLPNTPRYVKGVTFWKGYLLPVIDLSQRIKRQSVAADALMLITEIGGAAFGLLIDDDGETLPADRVSIKQAPFIVQTSWLKHMLLCAGEIIPLVDVAMALSSGTVDEKPVWQRYAPDFAFPDLLFKHDVEVVEFSLLGEHHALPKVEVEDVIAFKPCRALSDVPPIVIGVAEHKGEILPVVDLAMMFGRRSLAMSSWRMMLVKNGDFRALVITETIFGERRLALEIQRVVPILLPHQFVYGCYPDADVARLILSVETISVYFEKTHINKFLPALSHEMKLSPTGVVYNFLDEKVGKESQPPVTAAPVVAVAAEVIVAQAETWHRAEPEPAPAAASAAATSAVLPEDLATRELEQQAEEDIVDVQKAVTAASRVVPEPELGFGQMDVAHAATSSASTQESLSSSGEWSEWDADDMMEGEEFEDDDIVSHAEDLQEEMVAPESITAAAKPPETSALPYAASAQRSSGKSSKAHEQVVISEQQPVETLKAPVQNELALIVSATAPLQAEKMRESVRAKSGGRSGSQTVIPFTKPAAAPAPQAHLLSAPIRATPIERPSGSYRTFFEEQRIIRERKRRVVFGVIAAVLIAVIFYFTKTSNKPVVEQSVLATEPVKTEQAQEVIVPPVKTKAELAKEKAELAKAQAAQVKLEAAQAKAKAKAEREAKLRTEQEARQKAAQEAKAKVQSEREAKLKVEQEAKSMAAQARLQAAQAKTQAKTSQTLVLGQEAKSQTVPPRPAENLRAPLELDIPKHMPPVDIDVYVVVKDDTLWNISERFTGDPFNYPRIAGENKIANPDLIFPGQRIRLIK